MPERSADMQYLSSSSRALTSQSIHSIDAGTLELGVLVFLLKNLEASTSYQELIKHVAKTFGTMKILSRER